MYLNHPGEEDVGEVGVDDLELLGRLVGVLIVELGNNYIRYRGFRINGSFFYLSNKWVLGAST